VLLSTSADATELPFLLNQVPFDRFGAVQLVNLVIVSELFPATLFLVDLLLKLLDVPAENSSDRNSESGAIWSIDYDTIALRHIQVLGANSRRSSTRLLHDCLDWLDGRVQRFLGFFSLIFGRLLPILRCVTRVPTIRQVEVAGTRIAHYPHKRS
jgi:hypothetical protein